MILFSVAIAATLLSFSPPARAEPLEISGAFLRLIEEIEIPAARAGAITRLDVREGALVRRGDILAALDEQEAALAKERAEVLLAIAQREAEDRTKLLSAQKSLELARVEFDRAQRARERFPDSVSESELDQRRLTVEQMELASEQAKHELALAALNARLKHKELESAELELARRQARSTIDGMVVQLYRRAGEWVEPGDKLLRIVRIDRLRAEGFAPADAMGAADVGKAVTIEVDRAGRAVRLPGKISFISPEVNQVSGQVSVWAEFDNPDLQLRPGMRAKIVLE